MGKTIWEKSQGSSEPPSDLPEGRYELRFQVSQTVADAAIVLFWQQKMDTKSVTLAEGQTFTPVSIYSDSENTAGTLDLVLLVDLVGFWPQLIAIALAALGLGLVAYITLREIRQIASTPAGQLALAGGGLLLLAVVGIILFMFTKSGGKSIGPIPLAAA